MIDTYRRKKYLKGCKYSKNSGFPGISIQNYKKTDLGFSQSDRLILAKSRDQIHVIFFLKFSGMWISKNVEYYVTFENTNLNFELSFKMNSFT